MYAFRSLLLAPFMMASVVAQAAPPPVYRLDAPRESMLVTVTSAAPAMHVLLGSLSSRVVPFFGTQVLADGVVLGAVAKADVARFSFPVPPAVAALLGVRVQALTIDGDDVRGAPVVETRSAFDTAHIKKNVPDADSALLALDLQLTVRDDIPGARLDAHFEAHSDGYALRVVAVVRHDDASDVYLALKTPGPGEGMRDLVEQLHADALLGVDAGARVRVFATASPAPFATPLAQHAPLAELPIQ